MREAGDVLEAEREAELRREHDGHFLINRADDITFTTHVVTRSEVAHRFAQLEVFKDLCSDLIGPGAILYWDQLVYKKPETDEEFPWHQDNGYTFVSPEAYLTCWVPLTEATEENGCPWVVPEAHRLGTLKHWSTPLGLQCVSSSDDISAAPTWLAGLQCSSWAVSSKHSLGKEYQHEQDGIPHPAISRRGRHRHRIALPD